MSEQTQEKYGEDGVRLSAAELFGRWKRAVEHGEDNYQIGMRWMNEANRLAKREKMLLAEIETLRFERDEARREVCSMNETGLRMNESDKKREANRRGWDCFKEKA